MAADRGRRGGDRGQLAGRPLEPGEFTITAEENARLESLLGGEPAGDGGAHPIYAFFAPTRGIGTSIAELFELLDYPLELGPMLGTCELELSGELRLGEPYAVTGEIVAVERKSGRRAGTFELATVRERLLDREGRTVATMTNQFVLRRDEA